ncbi:MAG: ATP-binding cassette domain-containing protein [Candidatus Hodarchaeales archaeon]
MDDIIEIKDLTKQYMTSASVPILALRNLNLDVHENEICSIMGPSGCGKTTLLNMVGGIDYPTSGFIRVGDYYLTSPEMMPGRFGISSGMHTDFRRKTVGFVFQLHNLSPVHNAIENIELPMIFAGVPREERKKRSRELLNDVGMTERASHRLDALSGGERQRIAVAAAFANQPPVILADEPTGELDRENTLKICELFLKMKEIKDFTMILVTHNPVVAMIGDRILEIRDGSVKGEIPKSVLKGNSYSILAGDTQGDRIAARQFPPAFCSSCGSNTIITPKTESRSGLWMEISGKRTDYEMEFAQCTKCGKIFWQPSVLKLNSEN